MKSNFRVWFIALLGMFVFGITDAYAGGTAYSRARAYLKEGSPTAAGKVYVSTSSSTPAASSYKSCTSSTTAASSAQVKGASTTTTYHFWAQAIAGYKFTGWYSKNASGVYTSVSSNAHYSVSVTSNAAPSSGEDYKDMDLYAEFLKLIQLSFIEPTNGTYDITHKGAAVSNYASFTVDGSVKLTAHPAPGYKLRGWYTSTNGGVTKKYFAFGTTCEPNNLTADATIGADFVIDDGRATFWPKGSSSVYEDLNAAVTATSSGGVIVVVSDGLLAAGNYTINKNITLLLPYSTTNNKMTEPNIVHVTAAGAAPALSTYRKLSLAPGANITVANGSSICLGGSIASVNGGNASSFPCGPSGILDLSQGGEVTLNSGATLYAWGFVQGQNMDQGNNTSGVGHITAKSGATVWEDYQVGDWRGGTASSSIYNSRSSWKFFPFQSWTIQNIEAPITFEQGANGKGFWTIFGDGQVFTVKFDYLASSGSLFTLNDAGSTLEKWYDPTIDKVCYQLGGGSTTLDAMTLSAMGTTITTNDYNLPVPCNMSIILKSGTFTVSKPVVMHAGANMEVQSGATFNVSTSVYMFDQSEWGKYCMYYGGSDVYFQEFNTMTKHYTRGARTAKTNLTDAAIEVNGTMVVTGSGKLYSTASGCQVTGNNGGVVRFAGSLPSSTSITMCSNLKNTNSVSMANVNLQNEDQTFTKSKGSSYFDNVNGRWFIRSAKNAKSDHTWDFTYIKSGAKNGTGGTDATVSAVYSNDKTGDVDRMKWFNVTADECDDWWVGPSSYLYNWTLNDAWHQFIPTGGGMYSGSDGLLHKKGADCEWDVPDYPQVDCFYNVEGTLKALVGAELIEVEANSPDDHAWHKKGAASTYYIRLSGCIWKAATRIAGYSQAYTTTSGGKKYIWYGDQWLEATEDAPYFQARIDNKLKYFEWNGSAWTLMEPVAEVTKKGTTAEYIRFSDVMNAIDSATANTTVRLLKDITLTSKVTYSNNKQVTFNLNGFTLSGGVNELITINHASAIFIVIDGSAGGTGKIDMTFAKADARSTAINVVAGRLILNSGKIHAENTHASQPTCAIELANGTTFTQNGGRVEAASAGDTWGIHTASGSTTAQVNINGGVDSVSTTATELVVSAIMSEGGKVNMSGGTIKVSAIDSKGWQGGTAGIRLNHANCRLAMNGGTIIANAKAYARGIYITSTSAKDTINGGVIRSVADSVCAFGIQTYGQTIVNDIDMDVTGKDWGTYGIYNEVSGSKLWVNGGRFNIHNTASSRVVGVYSNNGNDTINGGEFTITSKNGEAYGFYLKNTIASFVVNGGKFKVTGKNGADTTSTYAAIWAEEGGDTSTKFKIAGGYYNMTSNLGSRTADGKGVFELDPEVEGDLIEDGYIRKVRGAERTVTWKNKGGAVLKTEKVEEGKVPVYIGATPEYISDYGTYEFDGWSATDGGALISPLPAVGASDVTYFAHYIAVYAEVTANGKTTKWYSVSEAWTAAMAYKQATIKVMCSAGNLKQLVFNPTPDNAIITLDLNGHTWGMNGSKDGDKDCFIKVNKAGCKLIITDNSESHNGYIHTGWSGKGWPKNGTLRAVDIEAGEVLLQNGGIKCRNSYTTAQTAVGVKVQTNTTFTMTDGIVEVERPDTASGGTAYGVFIEGRGELAGGTIKATHKHKAKAGDPAAYGVAVNTSSQYAYIGDSVTVRASGWRNCYAVYARDTCAINGGTYTAHADSADARGVYTTGGETTISGSPLFNVSARSTAYGVLAYNSGAVVHIDGGTYNVMDTVVGTCIGLYCNNNSAINVKNCTVSVTAPVNGGNNHHCVRCGTGTSTQLNISGGTYSMTKGDEAVSCFGGTTRITGNPVFTAQCGIAVAYYASAAGTATAIVDGGTFNCTDRYALYSTTHTKGDKTVTGDLTVLDGKFNTASRNPINASAGYAYMKIKGGYFTYNGDSKLSVYDAESNPGGFVESPSTVETLTSGAEYDAGYRYHVINKHSITWNSERDDLRTDDVEHNTMPDYGGKPTHSGTDTYEFTGWNSAADGSGDTVTIAKEDLTYTAQWRKLEAEVIEGDDTIRYETFTEAFNYAKTLSESTVRILSNLEYGTMITLDSLCVLTIDLNNHTVNYTSKDDGSYALTINRAGSKLIIDDRSIAKEGEFTHFESKEGRKLHGVHLQNGELELAGGTLRARNSTASSAAGAGAYAVVGENGTVFTQTGGKLAARCRMDARAYSTTGTGTFNATGGTIEVTTKYGDPSYYGTAVYGVLLSNNGTFNMSGSAAISVTTGTGAYGVYVDGSGGTGYPEANISGGSITCLAKNQCEVEADANGSMSRPVQANGTHATATISGGDFDTDGAADKYNIEDVVCTNGGTVNISGGRFHSKTGANCVGVRVFSGTATIGGDADFDSKRGVVVGDYATSTTTATAYVNGGTFNCPEYALYATQTTTGDYTVTGTMYVNGGYFKAATGKTICCTSSKVDRLILNGGYYNETSSTTQKTNITTYKGGSATVTDLASTDPAYSDDYRYHISTPYTVTWEYGDVSESETVDCGVMPSKDLTTYTYGGKIYYVTGWSPALSVVTGNITYTAVSAAYEAAVTVDETTTRYTSFADAWEYAMAQTEATVTLLNNANLSTQIIYAPTVENGRHTLDLNNFTLSYTGTGGAFLKTNRADARLTITDNSVGAGGILRHHTDYAGTSYAAYLYGGELVLSGGQLSVQNTTASKYATCVFVNPGATFTMTGGTVKANAKSTAKGISVKGTATISGSADIDVDSEASAYSIDVNNAGTATVSGGTFDATTTTFSVFGIYVQSGASATVSGGTFSSLAGNGTIDGESRNVECFGAYVTGDGSSLSISGGTFNANSSDNTGGNMNIVRVQVGSTATISGGTFQSNASSTIGLVSFGGVTTVSGTALFRAKSGVTVGTWYAGDGTNNVTATVNLNGGTFDVTGYVINATWSPKKDAESPFVNSVINVNSGHYKTTGSNIIYKRANSGGTATLTINGGYFNEKSGETTFKNQIDDFVTSPREVYAIESSDPNYEDGYRYCVTNGHPVASVQTGDEMSHYTTVLAAMNYARTVEDPTITILEDASLTERWSINTPPDNWHGILDLNGHTVTGAGSDYEIITVKKAGIKLTIRDSSVGKTGKITHEESTRDKVWGVNVSQGELELESGTIYVKNSTAGVDAVGVCTNINEDAVFTMTGGKVETHSAINAKALYLYGGSTTISGGKVISISELSGTLGAYAHAIYMAKKADGSAPSLTVSAADSIYAKAATTAYGLNANNTGTATIGGTPYFIAESPEGGARVLQSYGTFSVEVNGGTFEAKAGTPESYTLIPEGSSTMTVNGGRFATNQSNIVYKGGSATLTINGGYFNENSGTNHKTTVNANKGSGKAVIDLDTDDAEYIAGYRYIVTDDPVAKVKEGSTVTYYTTINAAITAANSAAAASTITMLQDATVTEQMSYTNSQNCTLDLNGHTITSTTAVQSPLSINCSGSTFIITDNTDSKLGKLSMTTSYEAGSGVIFGAYVGAGTLQLDGGTLEVIVSSGTRNTCGVSVVSSFIMNGGTIHVNNTNGSDGRGVYFNGSVTINDGTIHVESTGNGYGFRRDAGTITVNGGKFNINGATANINHTESVSGGVTIRGGWYNTNNRLNAFVPSPYHVFDLAGQIPYLYEVAEGYNLTWDMDGGAISVAGTPAGYVKVGTAVTDPTVTKTGYDFNAWSPDVAATMPAENTTYTATWTPTTYTLSYDLDGGSVASENPTSYTIESSAITLNNPTKANHVFTGWTGTGLASATMTVTISAGSTGNRSYTATWTEAEASVTDGGATTYYTTVAAAITAANALSTNPTVTMLKNVSTTQQIITKTMTIDLNGKTISSTQATSNTGVFKMNASGETLTIRDSGTGGMIDHTATISGGALVGIYVYAGSLRIESGIIYAKNPSTTNSSQAFGIATESICGLTMTGGTVAAEAYKEARGLWINGTTSLTDATVTSTSTNDISYAVQANAGALTVHSGTYTATGTTGYAVRERAGTVSIEGGKFSGSTQDFYKEGGTASISGGYYVHNTDLATYVTEPDYVLATTAADKAAQGNAYNWKVAEAYTLTWNLDGGTVSVAGTGAAVAATGSPSTTWAVGDAIVAPTVVKTNYVFAGWSSTPAATMPAEDVTYTATWTAAEASVAIGEGDPVYYATLAEAFTAAKAGNNAVITILKDISTSTAISYDPATAYTCTLDMNSHTVAYTGSSTTFLTVYRTGCKLIITDNTIAKGGKLKFDGNNSSGVKLVNIEYGEVELQNDTLYARNANASGNAIGVYTNRHAAKFTMTGGAVEAVRSTGGGAYGLRLKGLTNITGGVIKATAAGSEASGLYSEGDTLNIGGSISVSATVGVSTVSAVRIDGTSSVCNITGGTYTVDQTTSGSEKYNLECIRMNVNAKKCHITGGTFTATHTGTNQTYAVRLRGGELTIDDAVFNVNNGIYSDKEASTASVTINGGTFNCSGTYGFNIKNANCSLSVTGGKFNCSSAVIDWSQNGTINITGGYYSKNNNNLADYVAELKYVMATTAADKAAQGNDYNYKVSDAYTLTWDLAGGTVVEAGTGADVATTGTPSIRWAVGDAITIPTVTKSGYAFSGWSPAVPATMPAANSTYTATWADPDLTVTVGGTTIGYRAADIAEAYTFAISGSSATISILKDLDFGSGYLPIVDETTDFVLNLNNHTISTSNAYFLAISVPGHSFTINGGTGTIAASTSTDGYVSAVILASGSLTVNSGTLSATNAKAGQDAAAVMVGTATFTMNGGTLVASAPDDAIGIVTEGTTTIAGGKINAADKVIDYTSGTTTVTGGYFSNKNEDLEDYVNEDTHMILTLTASEKASVGSDYNYQVVGISGTTSKPLDIIDYSDTCVVLNMNGYQSVGSGANWILRAYGNLYTKSNRKSDRTLVIDTKSASLSAGDHIRIIGTAAESNGKLIESDYTYVMPRLFTENTTLSAASATDILYVKSDTLTVDANITVNAVYVCPDATLIINSGKTLTADSLILRTVPFHSAELINNGTLAATKVYYTRQIARNDAYYEIALPFNVTLVNVRLSNGKKATYGTNYGLMKYDGQSRADNGHNVLLNWKTLSPDTATTMYGKLAYQMISASAYFNEFYFPITYSKRAEGETVAVTAYARAQGDTPKGDKGWNFITTPYPHAFACVYGESPEDGLKIAWRAEDNTSFNQDVATAIKPTQAFYYQTETTGSLVFSSANFHFAAMPRRAMQSLSTQWIRLHYSEDAEGASADVTNIYLNDEKFTSAYETGYDVAKWSLDGGQPLIWTVVGSYKLAFAALPDSVATNSIPLTVFNPTAGAFTFSLELNRYMKRLEHVYLWDTYTNTTVDLMEEDYTETLGAGTIEGRFFLYTRNVPAVTTDIDLINGGAADADSTQPRKVIIEDKVFIIRGEHIYSIDGQLVK